MLSLPTKDIFTKEELQRQIMELKMRPELQEKHSGISSVIFADQEEHSIERFTKKVTSVWSGQITEALIINIILGNKWQRDVYNKGIALARFREQDRLVLTAKEVHDADISEEYTMYEADTLFTVHESWDTSTLFEEKLFIIAEELPDGQVLSFCGDTPNKARGTITREQLRRIKNKLGI